jgi:hypothetical protein
MLTDGFHSTRSKHHAQANIQTTIKATKNSTPHDTKHRTKRERVAMVSHPKIPNFGLGIENTNKINILIFE